MDVALQAVLFGLASGLGFGSSDYFAARASKRFNGLTAGFLVTLVAVTIYALFYILFFRSHTNWDIPALLLAGGAGVGFTAASLSFYKGLEYGPVNIVSPLGSLYPLISLLLFVVVFGQSLTTQQSVGVCIVVAGALIASGLLNKTTQKRRIGRGPLLGLCAALCWGVAIALITQAIDRVGWEFAALIESVSTLLAYVCVLPLIWRAEPGITAKILPALRNRWVLLAGVLIQCGFLALSMGVDKVSGLAPTVVAVSASYPVLTVFLALRNLKEKFQPIPLLGAFAAIAGIIVLSLG